MVFIALAVLVVLLVVAGVVVLRRSAEQERSSPEAGYGLADRLEAERIEREVRGSEAPAQPTAAAEPARGAPPVPGAQWDEVAGGWIRWDEATNAWVPLPDQPNSG